MTLLQARYFDGNSSKAQKVTISVNASSQLTVQGGGVNLTYQLDDVKVSARLGNTRRHLYFPDGSQCETDENDAIDELLAGRKNEAAKRLLHKWESSIGYAFGAIIITVVALWAGINYGVPALAKSIAFGLPADTEKELGQQALAGLDSVLLDPTQLSAARQAELRAVFSGMTSDIEGAQNYQLVFRKSDKIGPNALALPSGVIVVTDSLVNIAKSNNELVAVLAHEIGHLKQRHDLRRMLQGSATVVILIAVTGDLSSISSIGAGLPTLLVDSKYSRDYETEADDFSLAYLRSHHIPTEAFADILERIAGRSKNDVGLANYVSSHPATAERIKKFRG